MFQNASILAGFAYYGTRLLQQLTNKTLGQMLRGDPLRPGYRDQLALALGRLASPTCQLSLSEQVEVATFFMPLIQQQPLNTVITVAPTLRLTALPTKGEAPVKLTATVTENDAKLETLTLFRNKQPVASGIDVVLAYLDRLQLPEKVTYRAEALFANFGMLSQEIILRRQQYLLLGTGDPKQAINFMEDLAQLAILPNLSLRFDTSELRNMLVWVPASYRVVSIKNPLVGTTELLGSFNSKPLTLPTKGEGTLWASYQRIISTGYTLEFTLEAN